MIGNLAAVGLLGVLAAVSFIAGAEFSPDWLRFRRSLLRKTAAQVRRLMPRGRGAADAVPPDGPAPAPSPAGAGPSQPETGGLACCECCGFCGDPHGDPCEGGCNDAAPALVQLETSLLAPVRHAQAMHEINEPHLPPPPPNPYPWPPAVRPDGDAPAKAPRPSETLTDMPVVPAARPYVLPTIEELRDEYFAYQSERLGQVMQP